jgi:CubicO group peptidase (beta-lactamase class C family)
MASTDQFAESPVAVGLDSAKLDALWQRAAREVREALLPSVQVAVARQGKIAAMRTFGYVTRGGRLAPATNDTLYVAFSCTKAITCAAAWLLLEEGKLRLEQRVCEVIPEFATNGKDAVRVEHLFTHTAGFPYAPLPPLEWEDRAKRLERFRRWRLDWEPGSRFEYHPTSTMWVLAELIERCTGRDFRDFIRARVTAPLGLHDLYLGLPDELNARVADVVHVGRSPDADALAAAGFPTQPLAADVTEQSLEGLNHRLARAVGIPGGGGIMTAAALALFYQALLADADERNLTRIWRASTLRLARTVRTGELTDPLFEKRVNRGLGIVIAGDQDREFRGFGRTGSAEMFGHDGAGGQIAWADPESGISFVYFTNGLDRNPIRQARRKLALTSAAAALLAE